MQEQQPAQFAQRAFREKTEDVVRAQFGADVLEIVVLRHERSDANVMTALLVVYNYRRISPGVFLSVAGFLG